jgi:hypothetical protein
MNHIILVTTKEPYKYLYNMFMTITDDCVQLYMYWFSYRFSYSCKTMLTDTQRKICRSDYVSDSHSHSQKRLFLIFQTHCKRRQ